ncbi:alpha/beta fold hydrolase [Candidatus Thorarchaeota archaeon]|nr:MAG: alpha/beta fold hydrolase [Candidatus Thorarchaeota archaeon]
MLQKSQILTFMTVLLLTGSLISILFSSMFTFPQTHVAAGGQDAYDISFWNLDEVDEAPYDIINTSSSVHDISYDDDQIPIMDWRFTFFSENYSGRPLRIGSILMFPMNYSEPMPSVLFLHGYGSQASDFLPMMYPFVANGFVALAIDAPGCGQSSMTLPLNPRTFFNVTSGPQGAHIYHSVWAASRALGLLESLDHVDATESVVLGVSMGGLETFILAAIDDRVEAAVPIDACGNFMNSIAAGSFLNSVIDPSYAADSVMMDRLVRWFDPIGYARQIDCPVFMLFGTSDEFFPISSFISTYRELSSDTTLNIVPNSGHDLIPERNVLIREWIHAKMEGTTEVPELELEHKQVLSPVGYALSVESSTDYDGALYVVWRTNEPGASWVATRMLSTEDGYRAILYPTNLGNVRFFICTSPDLSPGWASPIEESWAGSFIFPAVFVACALSLIFQFMQKTWQPSLRTLAGELPIFVGIAMVGMGLTTPFFAISGRAVMTFLDFVEIYGEVFRISGWLIPTIMMMISVIISLSLFRHDVPLKLTVAAWIPLMGVLVVLYLLFVGFFALAGALAMIHDGIGVYLLLTAIPALIILETWLRKRPPDILIDTDDLENLVFSED